MLRSRQKSAKRGLAFFCGLFGFTRRAYYGRKSSVRIDNDLRARKIIVHHVLKERCILPKMGGKKLYDKLKPEFVKQGIKCGRDQLFAILREENLLIKQKRKHRKTTDSNHNLTIYKNLIKGKAFEQPNQVWVSDITYIRVADSFYYLSLVTDLASRKIVGYALWNTLETDGCLSALRQALKHRNKNQALIHHSDRGVQYCSQVYTNLLKKNKIKISMSAKACPYENAVAERVNGILKTEFDAARVFENMTIALHHIRQSIRLYNRKRTHWGLELQTPDQVFFKGLRKAA